MTLEPDTALVQTTSEPPPPTKGEMTLFEHLAELRYRLLVSLSAIIVGSFVAYEFVGPLFAFLTQPFFSHFPADSLIGTGPAEAFVLKLKVAVFGAIIGVSPILFFQVWKFIEPGLLDHEKRYIVPFLVFTTSLFLLGCALAYYFVLPISFQFFSGQYGSIAITPQIRVSENLSFILQTVLAFGVVFQMPILTFFLARLGIIDDKMLIDFGRYAVVAIFIIAAILTPPDVVTQFLLAGPLLLLYGISILVAKWSAQKKSPENTVGSTPSAP